MRKHLKIAFVFLAINAAVLPFQNCGYEFNPDEYSWEYLKTVKLKTHVARKKQELKRKTLGSMRSIQKKKSLVRSFYKRVYGT
ncbi:MAG: hypothetical protein AABZ31_09420 [Bdellovibrionota bacterium]